MPLGQLERPEEAIEAYEEVVTRFRERPEAEIVALVAQALASKDRLLRQGGPNSEGSDSL